MANDGHILQKYFLTLYFDHDLFHDGDPKFLLTLQYQSCQNLVDLSSSTFLSIE